MILDATAGNRMMWKNKHPPLTIFMDKEIRLRVPPDVFACWGHLPFRDNIFDCVIFDPPHHRLYGPKSRHKDPKNKSWFGEYLNKRAFIQTMAMALKEFQRVSKSVCFKWCETRWEYFERTTGKWRRRTENPSLFQMLSLFGNWREINRIQYSSKYNTAQKTFWVTFIQKEPIKSELLTPIMEDEILALQS